jgi:hypothetical protein
MENKRNQSKPEAVCLTSKNNESKRVSVLQPNRRLREVAGTRNDDAKGIVECPRIGHDCC